jgi:hypothetical protein
MPQWSRNRTGDPQKYPDECWTARCPRADAPQLLRYDHHVVWIAGRQALLRTYQWAARAAESWPDELAFEISFTYAPGHPAAPREIQRLVDSLSFAPVEPSTERADER